MTCSSGPCPIGYVRQSSVRCCSMPDSPCSARSACDATAGDRVRAHSANCGQYRSESSTGWAKTKETACSPSVAAASRSNAVEAKDVMAQPPLERDDERHVRRPANERAIVVRALLLRAEPRLGELAPVVEPQLARLAVPDDPRDARLVGVLELVAVRADQPPRAVDQLHQRVARVLLAPVVRHLHGIDGEALHL